MQDKGTEICAWASPASWETAIGIPGVWEGVWEGGSSRGGVCAGEQSVRRASEAAGPPLTRCLWSDIALPASPHPPHGSEALATPVSAPVPPAGASGGSETFRRGPQPWPRGPD